MMGIHLWRKHSYVKVDDDQPGCIWTVFRMIHHHPWHNVKKMLPYKKHNKPHENSSRSNGITPEEEHEINETIELEEDTNFDYSASVNSSSPKSGSVSKRSIKARLRALIKEKHSSTKSDIQEQKSLLGDDEEKCYYDSSAPTLMSLLKENPKLIRSVSRVDDSKGVKHGGRVKHKDSKKHDGYVGVLELFNVDQDLFLRILDDVSPRNNLRKPRLV